MDINYGIDLIYQARGLPAREARQMQRLADVFREHFSKNAIKERYYNGKIPLQDVNLGIALPQTLINLEIGCAWGAKAVDVLASRSMFDGFVGSQGAEAEMMQRIANANSLTSEYAKAARDELKYGCTFATLLSDGAGGASIRFHSPRSAAAIWDGAEGRIECGFAIIATETDTTGLSKPTVVHLHTETDVWEISRPKDMTTWTAVRHPHKMGRPLMVPLVWDATMRKPFGRSRLREPIRHLIDGYIRTVANATIGLEFATSPQKYLLGVTDDQYDAIIDQKFKQYIGNILASTTNPETGEKPTFGQLQQGTIEPHVQMMRILATQFSAATGLSVVDTGVVNDANPTSSDAILAQTQTLVLMAEQLNAANGAALTMIAMMAQAIARNVTLDELTDEERNVIPHFRNPSMPSVAVTADAAVKIASVRTGFASTDVFLEMMGFSQADIRRIRSQESRAAGLSVLLDEFAEPEATINA